MSLYALQDLGRGLLDPVANVAAANARLFAEPSWLSFLPGARGLVASNELIHRLSKRYDKPTWAIDRVAVEDRILTVQTQEVLRLPFCNLLRFDRQAGDATAQTALARQPRVLVVAPLSGHFATLLRETVATLLRDHEVYVTDWANARDVSLSEGSFGLDDYVLYVEQFIRHLGAADLHVVGVCQPTVPVVAAVARMAARGEATPRTLTVMGGPIDARQGPTRVNELANQQSLAWFEKAMVHTVPAPYAGAGRRVYPGFLQLTSFVAMNPRRHARSYLDYYDQIARGDEEAAAAHRRFYDEYNAVLDLTAEFYLETVKVVFQDFLLARGLWDVRGERVRPEAITQTALFSVEGEDDDISGPGQTHAIQGLCTGLAAESRSQLTVTGAGHYGIFSGRRWREVVYPALRSFIAARSA